MSLLHVEDGPTVLSLSPDRASELGLTAGENVGLDTVRARLVEAEISLNDPDFIFYLPLEEQNDLRAQDSRERTRELTADDAEAFEQLTKEAPVDELDEAFVELDHWLVYGTFVDDKLVSAASMYPWGDTKLADLGVITLPGYRGRGLGRDTVRAISAAALARGYEPQYRCQLDNLGSVALAPAAGFKRFGQWEAVIGAED